MRSKANPEALRTITLMALAVLALAATCGLQAGCSPTGGLTQQETSVLPDATTAPTDRWSALLQQTPFPYSLPLPRATPTIVDGTYAKFERKEGAPVRCMRCADYAIEGGVWKLNLDRGIYRIYHEVTGWRSLGSYVLSKDLDSRDNTQQLVLFNDPSCPNAIGIYNWKLEEGKLILTAVEDTCAIRLRAKNLSNLPWLSCRPPSSEAGGTDHWPKPPGCE